MVFQFDLILKTLPYSLCFNQWYVCDAHFPSETVPQPFFRQIVTDPRDEKISKGEIYIHSKFMRLNIWSC